eukprot:1600865-Rhodomonas_salina.2
MLGRAICSCGSVPSAVRHIPDVMSSADSISGQQVDICILMFIPVRTPMSPYTLLCNVQY